MTEETKKSAAKPAAKAAAKPAKAAAPKAAPAAKKAAPKEKAAFSGKTIKIVQTGSPIGREASQRATLIGLGLNKRHRERVVQDTPETRGMLRKVQHLVKVVG